MTRFVCALALVLCLAPHAHAQNLGNSIKVDRLTFPITVGASLNAPAPCNIVGYLYYHGSFKNRPLQVVVHGATYNHTYWDFPSVNGVNYSYARYMAAPDRKYAVLAIDMLAAGESCRPDNGFAVTLPETGSALAQVLTQLRSGDNEAAYAFKQIVLVGHSAGSIAATYVQSQWHLADALVLTGARHIAAPPLPPGIELVLPFVPTLASLNYFQLPPDLRAALFYAPATADPAVVAADNASADFWTGGQVTSTFAAFLYPLLVPVPLDGVDAVTGPVLIQLGDHDALFPAGSNETEAALWTSTTPTIQTLADMGHDVNLHVNHEDSWRAVDSWLQRIFSR